MLVFDKLKLTALTASKILKLDSSNETVAEDLSYSEIPYPFGGNATTTSNGSTLTSGSWYVAAIGGNFAHGSCIVEVYMPEGNIALMVNCRQRQATISILGQTRGYNSLSAGVCFSNIRFVTDQNGAGSWDASANVWRLEFQVGGSDIGAGGVQYAIKHVLGPNSSGVSGGSWAAAPTPNGTTIITGLTMALQYQSTAYNQYWPVAAWGYTNKGQYSIVAITADGRINFGNNSNTDIYSPSSGTIYTHAAWRVMNTLTIADTTGTTDVLRIRESSGSVVIEQLPTTGNIYLRAFTSGDSSGDVLIQDLGGNVKIGDTTSMTTNRLMVSGNLSLSGYLAYTPNAVGDKIYLYSNTYGIGIESSTLTMWTGSQFRWRIGGTSSSSGTEYMIADTATFKVLQGALQIASKVSGITAGYSLYVPTDGELQFYDIATFTPRMLINSSGNVAIGHTSPQGLLHLNGRLHFSELASNPTASDLTSSTYSYPTDRCAVYMKSNKLIIAYVVDGSSTVHYTYIALDGTSTGWTHTTTAP